MANCVTCKARCENAGQHRVKTDCISYIPKDYPKSQTNYDLLISKTPEELAKWFCQWRDCDDWHCPYCNNDVFGAERCGLIGWLKSPAEDGK